MQIQIVNKQQFCEMWGVEPPVMMGLISKGLPHFNIEDNSIVFQTDEAYQWMRKHYHQGDASAEGTHGGAV